MSAIFLSDVHLRDSDSVKTKLVIRFLQEVASQFEDIYILGDLFDVWPGTNAFLVQHFDSVLQALKCLVDRGHHLHYVEGNHDFRLGGYFSKELRIKVHPEMHEETWNGKRVLMMHGDLGNPRDLSYRLLRKALRADILHLAMKVIPDDFIFDVGLKSSRFSRGYQKKLPRNEAGIRQVYCRTAEKKFSKGYDVVLMGHTHLPDDVTTVIGNRSCRYINIGDWVQHFTYLEFDGTQFYTKTHPVKSL